METKSVSVNRGMIASVRGSVIDVRFEERLPPIYTLLRAGKDAEIAIEVLMHLDRYNVRGCRRVETSIASSPCLSR